MPCFRFRGSLPATALVATLALLAGTSYAQRVPGPVYKERRGIADRWNIRLGSFVKKFDTIARLDEKDLDLGTEIPLEDTLGLDSDSRDFRLDSYYRIGRKQRIVFGYTNWKRGSTITLEEEIEWEDLVFLAGAEVRTQFDEWMLKLAWKYSVVNNGKLDAGFSAGLTTFKYDLSLAGEARFVNEDGDTEFGFAAAAEDLIAPVPLLGVHVEWTIRPRLFLSFSGEWFRIDINKIEAGVSDVRLSLDYYVSQHFGFGMGYHVVKTDILERDNPVFKLDYDVEGAQFYFNFAF